MKEIKILEEKLFEIEQLISEAKQLVYVVKTSMQNTDTETTEVKELPQENVDSDKILINERNMKEYSVEVVGHVSAKNVLVLVINDKDNNIISDAVVIVKEELGIPVRAGKSNNLGQVNFGVPLKSGIYSIEILKDGYKFPQIKIKLVGNVLNPIKIKAL